MRLRFLLPLMALCACKSAPPAAPPPAAKEKAAVVQAVHVAVVKQDKLPAIVDLSGTLDADERSEVATAIGGLVTEVAVDVGSKVKKGDLLVRIDRRDAAMRLAQASAATAQAGARLGLKSGENFNANKVPEVQAAREALVLAETELKRAKALVQGGSSPQSMLDQAASRQEQAKAQYEVTLNGARTSWAALQAAKAAEDLTEKATADTNVVAPFDGVIDAKRIAPGEYATLGKVVAVLVRTDPLRLRVDVPEAYAGSVKEGGEVMLTVGAYPDRVFKGVIKRIGAALKVQSRTLAIEAEVTNTDGVLKPGFFAHVALVVPGADTPTLLVPATAIGTSGSAARVFVIQGGGVIERIVSVGRTWQGLVEIHGALKAGETVATEHLDLLTDGAQVKAIQE
jgi:RND family efflux transporter MFP subunit